MTAEQPWSVPVAIHSVPETGRSFTLVADEPTRAAVAKLASVSALPRLEAHFDVSLRGRNALHVTGQVSATVGQTCVVTLVPIENEVVEDIDLVFAPDAAPVIVDEEGAQVEVATVDAPEPLIGGTVDLGGIATEFLILAIDPYPRAPGALFEPPAPADEGSHPFAALAALKKGRKDG
jgi:hypothetical protein